MAAANVAGQGGRSEAFGQYHTCNREDDKQLIFTISISHQYCGGSNVDDEADDGDEIGCNPHRAQGDQPIPISEKFYFNLLQNPIFDQF